MALTNSSTRKSKITVPVAADPRAKVLFAEMKRQAVTYEELEARSGVLRSTFKAWRTNNKPGLDTLEAALGVVGWDLLPVPKPDRLDPELRADLEALADKHGLDAIPHRELLASCIAYRHPHSNVHAERLAQAA